MRTDTEKTPDYNYTPARQESAAKRVAAQRKLSDEQVREIRAELEECIDELYRRMDRVDPPDDYPTMAEQYRRAERWKRIEAAAQRLLHGSDNYDNPVVMPVRRFEMASRWDALREALKR